jgi:hypothetical protein
MLNAKLLIKSMPLVAYSLLTLAAWMAVKDVALVGYILLVLYAALGLRA